MTGPISTACISLTKGGWPDAVHQTLLGHPDLLASDEHLAEAARLAWLGRRVLGLDAEDFGALAGQFTAYGWSDDLVAASFPAEPRDPQRGALGSLVPIFELMLEASQIRMMRADYQSLVVNLHLMAEYVCQLAWESVLGHGGDPLRMGNFVGERWGKQDSSCPHPSALRATARRSLHACSGDVAGYVSYLDKFHSRLGEALAQCAMNHKTIAAGERPDVADTCPKPCAWATGWGSREERRDLDARLRLAVIFIESPVISLRHHAPVGHFFGVPSLAEITEGWERTWQRLSQPWADGLNPLQGVEMQVDEREALPGLTLLMSTIAARPVGSGTLLQRIGKDLVAQLSQSAS